MREGFVHVLLRLLHSGGGFGERGGGVRLLTQLGAEITDFFVDRFFGLEQISDGFGLRRTRGLGVGLLQLGFGVGHVFLRVVQFRGGFGNGIIFSLRGR